MSTTNITGKEIGPILVNSSDDTYNVKKGATLMVGGDGGGGSVIGAIVENIENPAVNHDNIYNIDGRVIGYEVGIYTAGDRDKITIGTDGEVIGSAGVAFTGSKVKVVNNGEILAAGGSTDSYGAIYTMQTTAAHIENNGLMSGAFGILLDGSKGRIVNGENGLIAGTQAGIVVGFGMGPAAASPVAGDAAAPQAKAGPSIEVINHGTVTVSKDGEAAFAAQGINVTLTNDGTMRGVVGLGDGNSVFDNRGGIVTSTIIGGGGDDVLIVDAAKYKLVEEAAGGNDTVKSTVTYKLSANVENLTLLGNADIDGTGNAGDNTLRGNGGNNTLDGLAGADDLFGGKGNDKLSGGGGGDEFHFATGDGHDKIMDLIQGTDKIDFSGWDAVDSLNKVKAHAEDQDGGVLISAGSDSVLIVGLHKTDLGAGDFDFAS